MTTPKTSPSPTASTLFVKQHAPYKRARPSYPAALYDRIEGLLPERSRQLAWDCGCGSGQATAALAERFAHVIATDVSAPQLELAPALKNVRYLCAPAESVEAIKEESVDLVVAATAFHWFDEARFYAEAWRVLKPHGALALWSYARNRIAKAPAVNTWSQRFSGEVLGPFWMPQNHTIMRAGYDGAGAPPGEGVLEQSAAIFSPELIATQQMSCAHYMDYLRSWSASQRYEEAHGEGALARHGDELERLWADAFGSLEHDASIEWPLFGRAFIKG